MKERWVCIEGGSSVIIDGMLSTLSALPIVSKRVTSIAIERSKPKDLNMRVQVAGEQDPRYYSTVFNSTTLGAAQRMDLSKAELHHVQKDAIRSLRYDASCKVAIRFKSAWWIKGGIKFGGTAKTDSPIRVCVYPSYNIDDDVDSPAVLLCSYTWAQDAQRMGTLIGSYKPGKNKELKDVILNDLAKLHPFISLEKLHEQFYEMHAFDWYADPNYSGAFALFGPGQFKNLYPILSRPTADGNLHLIGEGTSLSFPPPSTFPSPFTNPPPATSTHHAWIVGALNSSYRGVYNMLKKYQLEKTPMRRHWQKKIIELQTKWGTIDELDTSPEGTAHLNVLLGRLRGNEMVVVDF